MLIETRHYKTCILIFLLAMLSRLVVLLFIVGQGDAHVLIRDDEQRYFNAAVYAMHDIHYWKALHWDVPLYSFILSWVFRIFPATYLTMIFLNITFFSASVSLVYLVGTLFFKEKAAWWASALFGLYPTMWMISLYPAADVLFLCIMLLSVYLFIRYVQESRVSFLIFCSFGFVLLTLAKEVAAFLPALFAVILIFVKFRCWKQVIKHVCVYLAIYIVCLLPLCSFNYVQNGEFTLSRKMTRVFEDALQKQAPELQRQAGGVFKKSSMTVGEYVFYRRRFFCGTGTIGLMHAFGINIDVLEQATDSAGSFVRATTQYGRAWFLYHWWSIVYVALMYLFACCGMGKLLLERRVGVFFSISLAVLYFLGAYYSIFNARYFIQFIPLMSLLSVYWFQKPVSRA